MPVLYTADIERAKTVMPIIVLGGRFTIAGGDSEAYETAGRVPGRVSGHQGDAQACGLVHGWPRPFGCAEKRDQSGRKLREAAGAD